MEEPPSPGLIVTLFGPIEVWVQGNRLPPLRSRKALSLLALLTLRHGRPVEREWLAGTLWPDSDQSQCFANLRFTLSILRSALGPEAERLQAPNRRTLLLDYTGARVDLLDFDTAIARGEKGDLPALEHAVALYRGPFLEGCADEWLVHEREARSQAVLRALQMLGEAAMNTGDPQTAVDHWRRAVQIDPLWETVQRQLMNALATMGDTNAALQVYREFVATIQSGGSKAIPATETTALYHRLREEVRQKARVSTTSPGNETPLPSVTGALPHPLTELVGREDECLKVAALLRRSLLVTLTGLGGIGKTRLAIVVANEVIREFPDGAVLVPLESLPAESNASAEESERSVLQLIASLLKVKSLSGQPLRSLVAEHLSRKRLLLVLDNCEHLLESCASVVSHLLRECAGLRILATSREALRVSGESVWSVPALLTPDPAHLPQSGTALVRAIAGYDAVRLFIERAEAARKTFTLTGNNAREVALLCARLEGMPLALELAAARTAVLTPAQILEQFAARPLDALASRFRDVPARHRTLRATLEWSIELLPPDAQTFLASMGIFRGSWTLEAAQAVCPGANAMEMLTLLRDANLITVTVVDAGNSRFSLLETVRQFAVEELQKTGRWEEARKHHAHFYAQWVTEAFDGWQEEGRSEFERYFALIEGEYPNVSAALAWACEYGVDDMPEILCFHLAQFWDTTGRVGEAQEWFDVVSRRINPAGNESVYSDPMPPEELPTLWRRERFLYVQATILSAAGDYEKAAEISLQIFELYRWRGTPVEGRTALFNAGLFFAMSDLSRALPIYERSLPLEREYTSDGRANPVVFSELAFVARRIGQLEKSAAFLNEALILCQERQETDPHGYLRAMRIAGTEALDQEDLAMAQDYYEKALFVARQLGDGSNQAYVLYHMAALARETGDLEQAEAYLSESFTVAGPNPRLPAVLRLQRERAESLLARGDRERARITLRSILPYIRGKASSLRFHTHALLLLLADIELSATPDPQKLACAARLYGAAVEIAERLCLRVPNLAERRRTMRLHATLLEYLGAERLANESAAGSSLDDEAALQLALMV